MSLNPNHDQISNGYWKHVSDFVRKLTPIEMIGNYNFAVMGLIDKIMDVLMQRNGMTSYPITPQATEVLRFVILVDISKKGKLSLKYDSPLVRRHYGHYHVFNQIQKLAVASMIQTLHNKNDQNQQECHPDVDESIATTLRIVLEYLEIETGYNLRILAIKLQQKHDLWGYNFETRMRSGLEYLEEVNYPKVQAVNQNLPMEPEENVEDRQIYDK